jgi:endo-alpha-1,4-polygalactosaminidase (GH114 family)
MRPIKIVCFLLSCWPATIKASCVGQSPHLFICYGKLPVEEVVGYDTVILESHWYTEEEILQLKSSNKRVLAYISLTEAHPAVFYYNDIAPFIIGQNTHWGSSRVNIQNDVAKKVIYKSIKTILDKGFDGLFFDNLDNVSKWGQLSEMRPDLIAMLKFIRMNYPEHFFMQNGGLSFFDLTRDYTNAILIESVFSNYDFNEKKYGLRKKEEVQNRLAQIHAQTKNVSVYLVEYTQNKQDKQRIEKWAHKVGYRVFVANIDLQGKPHFQ